MMMPMARRLLTGPTGVLILWTATAAWCLWLSWRAVVAFDFPDTDDAMRLQQVRDWLGGQPWSDLTQHRMGFGSGFAMHWSRVVDLPLAAVIGVAKPLIGQATAERIACAGVPLITLGCVMGLQARLCARLIPWAWAGLAAAAIVPTADWTRNLMMPMRIDHHGWQLTLLLVVAGGLVARRPAWGGAAAAVASALALAIGLEMLPFVAVAGAVVVARAVAVPERETARLRAYGAGLLIAAPLFYIMFVPAAGRLATACDAFGPPVLAAAAGGGALSLLLSFLPPARWLRAGTAALGGALLLALLAHTFPACLADPYAGIGPGARRWLDSVGEAMPVLHFPPSQVTGMLTMPLLGLAGSAWRLAHTPGRRLDWGSIAALQATAIGLLFWQVRVMGAAELLAIPGTLALAVGVVPVLLRAPGRPLGAVAAAIAMALATGASGTFTETVVDRIWPRPRFNSVSDAGGDCASARAYAPLGAMPHARIINFIDLGPALLVRTPHTVLAGPYHRNAAAISQSLDFWLGSPAQARAIAVQDRATLALACAGGPEDSIYRRQAPRGLWALTRAGQLPPWLHAVGAARPGMRLYRIDP